MSKNTVYFDIMQSRIAEKVNMKTQNFKKVDLILKGLEKFNLLVAVMDKKNDYLNSQAFKVQGFNSLRVGTRTHPRKIKKIDEVFSFNAYPSSSNFHWDWSGFFSYCKKNGISLIIFYDKGHYTGVPDATTIAKAKKRPVIYQTNIVLQTKAKKPAKKKTTGLLGGL